MSKKKNTEKVIKNLMVMIGTYLSSFDLTISLLARMIDDYNQALDEFKKSGGQIVISHTNKEGHTNLVKNPHYQAIEGMRKDMLVYLRDLGLTPAGLKKIDQSFFEEEVRDSPLNEVLKRLM